MTTTHFLERDHLRLEDKQLKKQVYIVFAARFKIFGLRSTNRRQDIGVGWVSIKNNFHPTGNIIKFTNDNKTNI